MNETVELPSGGSQPSAGAATLHVLGGLVLRNGTGQPIELKARKSRQLLAYIAVPAGQARTRDQLAALLWSDRQDEQARGSLRTALSGIRRAIGDGALLVDQDIIRLRPGCLDTDYERLKGLADGDGDITKLDEFYAGEFLAGLEHDSDGFMDWLRGLRTECNDLAIRVLDSNAQRLAGSGENQAAIDLMRESLLLEPLKEQTHRTIMQLYAASGERAMALAQFRSCKELLLHELDATPAPETQELADSIALQSVGAAKVLKQDSLLVQSELETSSPALFDASEQQPDAAPSVAILPFVNMSGDAEQNFFADGMTEDIMIDLSDVGGLSVAAKSASQMYRGASIAPAQISKEIGVRYILEGSVRKAGNHVRISAHLTDAHSNLQVWAERYDRQLENIFELQSEISRAIVGALKINLSVDAKPARDNRTTANVEAYECFLRGQVSLIEGSKPKLEQALELFGQAVALDPGYALAWAFRARVAANLVMHYDVDRSMLNEAMEYCGIALDLHPDLAEAHSARGFVYIFMRDFDRAHDDIAKAILLAPDLAIAHFHMGKYHLNTVGGVAQAYHSYLRAFELGRDLGFGMMVTACLRGLDRPEELHALSMRILKIAKRRFSLNPHDIKAIHQIAIAYNDLGEIEKAKHWAGIASSFDFEDGAIAYNLACMHGIMGSVDEALVQLEKTLKLGCNELKVRFMKYTDPDLDLVREDPRFDKLLAKYGFNLRSRKPRRLHADS